MIGFKLLFFFFFRLPVVSWNLNKGLNWTESNLLSGVVSRLWVWEHVRGPTEAWAARWGRERVTLSPRVSMTGRVVCLPLVNNIPAAKYVNVMITHIPSDHFHPNMSFDASRRGSRAPFVRCRRRPQCFSATNWSSLQPISLIDFARPWRSNVPFQQPVPTLGFQVATYARCDADYRQRWCSLEQL